MARVAPEHRREQQRSADGYLPIEHHGLIGDLHTVALVGNEGTIDWFCPGRFDAPSLFGAILDARHGGSFAIQPVGRGVHDQAALPARHGGAGDALLHRERRGRGRRLHAARRRAVCSIVRRVEVVRGSLRFRLRCAPGVRLRAHAAPARDRRTAWRRSLAADADVRAALARGRASRPTRATRPSPSSRSRAASGRRSCSRAARPGRAWDEDAVERSFRETVDVLARLDRPEPLPRPLARDGRPLGDHAQAAHLPADRRGGGGARRRACPSTSAGRATGTTATAGCATRPSRCSRSCASASARRRSATWPGCTSAATCTTTARRCRSCTRIDGRSDLDRAGAPAPRRLPRLAAGAHRQRRGRSAPARRLRRGRRRGLPGRARRHADLATRSGSSCARSSTGWPTTGTSRTRASGRCAAGGATSPTRGS